MRILLINPPFQRLRHLADVHLPLGLAYLGAFCRQRHHDVRLYNSENPDISNPQERTEAPTERRIFEQEALYLENLHSPDFFVWKEVASVIHQFKPDLVGISVLTPKYGAALRVTDIVKRANPAIVTVWGGAHVSAVGRDVLARNPQVDFAICGEGEIAFSDLVSCLERGGDPAGIANLIFRKDGRVCQNASGPLITTLDEIPFPWRTGDVFQERYPAITLGSLMTSRGCPFQCSFCNSSRVWGHHVRLRSVDNVLREMEQIRQELGLSVFDFSDDTFSLNPQRILAFCEAVKQKEWQISWSCTTRLDTINDETARAMKASGLSVVAVGIESGSDRVLKRIKKNLTRETIEAGITILNRHGIDWDAFFMIGFPFETEEDIRATKSFMRRIKPTGVVFSIFTPYPGSELFEETRSLGLIPADPDWSLYSHQSASNHFVKAIPPARFHALAQEMLDTVERLNTSTFSYVRKILRRRGDILKHPWFYLRKLLGRW